MMLAMRVLIAGGGTGGHLFPGIAIAERLRSTWQDIDVLFVGTRRGLESRLLPKLGFALKTIAARGIPRRSWRVVPALLANAWSVCQSVLLCRRFNPAIVIGTGAYVSAPVLVAAKLQRRPCLVLEQNSVPGRTNRFLARLADEVHLADPASKRFFARQDNLRVSGNPVRTDLTAGDRQRAAAAYGLDPAAVTVLVVGGSQGAGRLNAAVVEALEQGELPEGVQWLVQTGRGDQSAVAAAIQAAGCRGAAVPFIDEMADAYALADLVVCRAGATTIAELIACRLPAVLVPYPHATDNHQLWNAKRLVDRGAAQMVADGDLTGRTLGALVRPLLVDPQARQVLVGALSAVGGDDATERVVEAIQRLVRETP